MKLKSKKLIPRAELERRIIDGNIISIKAFMAVMYYKKHYATEEERKLIREFERAYAVVILTTIGFLTVLITGIMNIVQYL